MEISPVLWQFLIKWLNASALFPREASTIAPWADALYFFLLLITIVGRRDVDLAARTRAEGRRFAGLSVEPDYPGLEALAGLVDSGQLRAHLQTTLPLAEAAKAHQLLESGRTTGKIVLTI